MNSGALGMESSVSVSEVLTQAAEEHQSYANTYAASKSESQMASIGYMTSFIHKTGFNSERMNVIANGLSVGGIKNT